MTSAISLAIRTGRRWRALEDALASAVEAFSLPATTDETHLGWRESDFAIVVTRLEEFRSALEAQGTIPELSSFDDICPDGGQIDRLLTVAAIENSLAVLQQANDALGAIDRFLGRPLKGGAPSEQREVYGVLESIGKRLRQGDYLTHDDLRSWGELLARLGCRRRTPDEPGNVRPIGLYGTLTNVVHIGHIEQYPPGEFWESVVPLDEEIIDFLYEEADSQE